MRLSLHPGLSYKQLTQKAPALRDLYSFSQKAVDVVDIGGGRSFEVDLDKVSKQAILGDRAGRTF